jgi:SAM-dependent methyltransferase
MSLPSDDFARKIFFEVHNNLSREGPGSVQSTLRALRSVDPDDKQLNILDIGCGPGMATIELAKLGHRVTAIDNNETFIKILLARAKEEGLSDRITTLFGDMFCLEKFIGSNTFDVIWSEGSIYIIGFERGLTEWKKFLKKDGYFVCSELSWLTADPPFEIREFWSKHYPGICSQEENFRTVRKCGYELIDSFVLAEKDWWDEYYGPMEERIQELKVKYKEHREAESVLDEQQSEIDMYKKYSENYGYVFYIMKK